jgi:hypothetical protein
VNIQYNVLYAVGYVKGKAVARDTITLFHLPLSPHSNKLYEGVKNITKGKEGYEYLYRINCGGPDYVDENGNKWKEDRKRIEEISGHGSFSWTDDFPELPYFFASQRRTFSPIRGTKDWNLFQTFRYGREKLKFDFDIEDGEYLVELYFIEPWLGIGGGMDAKSMRLFNVAINGKTVLKDLDIWKEAGTNKTLKKMVLGRSSKGKMEISFPVIKSGQALISAIAVAKKIGPNYDENHLGRSSPYNLVSWLDAGDKVFRDESIRFYSLPSVLYGAEWLQLVSKKETQLFKFKAYEFTDLFVGIKADSKDDVTPAQFENTGTLIVTDELGGTKYNVYRRRMTKGDTVTVNVTQDAIVCLNPANRMQPAYDLKPVTQYKSNVVKLGVGAVKEMVNGRECAVIKTNNSAMIEYPIQTGVADIYSITMKYYYDKQIPVKGRLQLIGAGNTMMLEVEVQFTFTNTGKWNQFTINTGNMINAGNYLVRLVIENAEGLAISGIDIQ